MSDTYSVAVRIRRTTTEYAYVRVPVTDQVMQTDESGAITEDENGHHHLDGAKVVATAVELANSPSVVWHHEGVRLEMDPIQKPLGKGEP